MLQDNTITFCSNYECPKRDFCVRGQVPHGLIQIAKYSFALTEKGHICGGWIEKNNIENTRVIRNSNLALRFYVADGWSLEDLQSCLISGSVGVPFPEDKDPYFVFDIGSRVDIRKLLSMAREVVRTFNDYPHERDYEFLKRFLK